MRLVRHAFMLLALAFAGGAFAQSVPMPDFRKLEQELRLKPHQRAQFDIATTSLKRSLLASAGTLMELKQQLADELMKSQPDFLALLERQRAAYAINEPIYRETLNEWGRLYALLEDDQVVIAKRFLQDALTRALPR